MALANLKIIKEPQSTPDEPNEDEVATSTLHKQIPLRKVQILDVDATLARSLPKVFGSDELQGKKASLNLKRKPKQWQKD